MQNKLEDLFSLTEFLRFYPVDNGSNIRQYILNPLARKERRVLTDLRAIMKSLSLRRAKVVCHNHKRSEYTESIILSSEERKTYTTALLQVRKMRSDSAHDTPSHPLLRAILKLRQICSHGVLDHTLDSQKGVQDLGMSLNCARCGNSLSLLQWYNIAGQDVLDDRLCHECRFYCNTNTLDSITPSTYSNEFSHNPITTSLVEDFMDTGAEVSVSVCNENRIYPDESLSKNTQNSSKLGKILSNLMNLQCTSNNSKAPIKR